MAQTTNTTAISGTGSKSILISLSGTPTWVRMVLAYGNNIAIGSWDGTRKSGAYTGTGGTVTNAKFLNLLDSSGTVIFEATISSVSSGTVTLSVTTNTVNPSIQIEAGN